MTKVKTPIIATGDEIDQGQDATVVVKVPSDATGTVTITVDGKKITIYAKANAAELPWGELGVDVVLECTGFYTSKAKSQAHIDAGAKKVVISAPAGKDLKTIVYNVNDDILDGSEEIISASQIEKGDNLIFLSKQRVNKLITEKLPYVGAVKIKRRLPAHLEIQVTKTDAVYGIAQNGYYDLLDKNGKVLETNVEYVGPDKTLINAGEVKSAVVGEQITLENEKALPRLKEVYEACEKVGLTDITEINITDLYNIKVVYQGRITLELGKTDGDRLSKKLAFKMIMYYDTIIQRRTFLLLYFMFVLHNKNYVVFFVDGNIQTS